LREKYDFSESKPNPYAREFKRQVTIRIVVAGWCAAMVSGVMLVTGCDKLPGGEKPAEQKAPENQTVRMSFQELFDVNGTMVTPKKIIQSGPSTMTPDVPFESNVMRIDNAPFTDYIGRDAEVKKKQDVYRIIRFY
jgi:hypothetical protein